MKTAVLVLDISLLVMMSYVSKGSFEPGGLPSSHNTSSSTESLEEAIVRDLNETFFGKEPQNSENKTDLITNSTIPVRDLNETFFGKEPQNSENKTDLITNSTIPVRDLNETFFGKEPQNSENKTDLITNSTIPDPPRIIKHPRSIKVQSKDEVIITCVFDTNVNCIWVKDGNSIQFGQAYQYVDDSDGSNTTECSIRIVLATVKDSGHWTCAAKDPLEKWEFATIGQPSNAHITVLRSETDSSTGNPTTTEVKNEWTIEYFIDQSRSENKSQKDQEPEIQTKASFANFIDTAVTPLIYAALGIGTAIGVALIIVIPAIIVLRIRQRKPSEKSQ